MTRPDPLPAPQADPHTPAAPRSGWRNRSAAIIVVLAFATGVSWSFVVPVFESPDEPHHWQYARYLHDEWRLPLFGPDFVEANSPPLYYLMLAPLAADSELPPHLAWSGADGNLLLPFAPRFYLNAADDMRRYWPIRASRLLTAVFMAIAVWYVFRAAVVVGGTNSAGVLAAAFVAFLPQFAFRGSTISNDSLVTTCAAAMTFHVMRALRNEISVRDGIWTGLWLAAAYLSKINAICLAGGIACAALVGTSPIRQRLRWAAVAIGTAVAVALPWSVRNVVLYGDPFASGAMHEAVKELIVINPLMSPFFYTIFPYALTRSFVGVFGWMNVWLPEPFYRVFGMIVLVGFVGALIGFLRNRDDRRAVIVLSVMALGALAVVVHINRTFHQPQGRYLFPGLPAIGLLWGLGMSRLMGQGPRSMALSWTIAGLLAFLNVVAVVGYVVPAYYPAGGASRSRGRAQRLPRPSFAYGLKPAADGWLEVTNTDPQIAFNTAISAEDFGFLSSRSKVLARACWCPAACSSRQTTVAARITS